MEGMFSWVLLQPGWTEAGHFVPWWCLSLRTQRLEPLCDPTNSHPAVKQRISDKMRQMADQKHSEQSLVTAEPSQNQDVERQSQLSSAISDLFHSLSCWGAKMLKSPLIFRAVRRCCWSQSLYEADVVVSKANVVLWFSCDSVRESHPGDPELLCWC